MRMLLAQTNTDDVGSIFGQVERPAGIASFDAQAGGVGLLVFISSLIQIFTVIAGLWVMFQLIYAGYQYISSGGDTSVPGKVKDRVTMALIGLAIIMSAYTITALVSYVLFGDASFILNPQISSPVSPST